MLLVPPQLRASACQLWGGLAWRRQAAENRRPAQPPCAVPAVLAVLMRCAPVMRPAARRQATHCSPLSPLCPAPWRPTSRHAGREGWATTTSWGMEMAPTMIIAVMFTFLANATSCALFFSKPGSGARRVQGAGGGSSGEGARGSEGRCPAPALAPACHCARACTAYRCA